MFMFGLRHFRLLSYVEYQHQDHLTRGEERERRMIAAASVQIILQRKCRTTVEKKEKRKKKKLSVFFPGLK